MAEAGALEHVVVALEDHSALLPRNEREGPFQV